MKITAVYNGHRGTRVLQWIVATLCPLVAAPAAAAAEGPAVLGIPVDFILFALTLLGVAIYHHYTLQVVLTGLGAIVGYKFLFAGFNYGPGLDGFLAHLGQEWVILSNLFMLLVGFALVAVLGWHPNEPHKSNGPAAPPVIAPAPSAR